MALSPVEIRHITFSRRPFGFKRSAVELALGEVVESFEEVWRDRADLADKVEQLENDLVRYRELEALLRTTLITAERTAEELKEQARRQADTILAEAHTEARRVSFEAHEQHARLVADTQRIKSLLESALAAVDEDGDENGGEAEERSEEDAAGSWHDTGERAA
jgi:cell division initiation protein